MTTALRYGERRWGEKYDAAIDLTGLEYGTLRNIVYVAGAVDLSRRRDKPDLRTPLPSTAGRSSSSRHRPFDEQQRTP